MHIQWQYFCLACVVLVLKQKNISNAVFNTFCFKASLPKQNEHRQLETILKRRVVKHESIACFQSFKFQITKVYVYVYESFKPSIVIDKQYNKYVQALNDA